MNLFFLPYERWTIHTTLSADEIQRRLSKNIDEADVYRSRYIHPITALYQGRLEADRFEIARVIKFRQEFLPVARGNLRDEGDRRAIDLVIRPQGVMFALFGIGIVAVGAGLCFVLSDALLGTANGSPGTALPFSSPVFLALVYAAYVAYFKTESVKARGFLTGILQ